jgi:hypothetical protein
LPRNNVLRPLDECESTVRSKNLQPHDDFQSCASYDRVMKKSSYFLVVVAIAAPFSLTPTRTNPAVDSQHTLEVNLPVPTDIDAMLHRACFNCHSSETKWPWYSRLPVAGVRIHEDVENARHAMNFSNWPTRPQLAATLLQASCAALQAGEMPKAPYTLLHPEARLSEEEKTRFCQWAHGEARELAVHKTGHGG